jgi:iron complex outermembrane receptor protein
MSFRLVQLCSLVIYSNVLLAFDDKNYLDYVQGPKRLQSIAAGHPVPENISPGVTSVFTSEDIDRIGARRLTEVLEYLPGVHVAQERAGTKVIGFRGIYSGGNQQVLVMVNGIPLRNTTLGGKPFSWDMPVKNISHVEVIRGPGSMLYGGDAISGVINIVLKNGSEINGGKVGGFFGSQDTYEGWGQYGKKDGDWDYSFSLQGGVTRGSKGWISEDQETIIDRQFGGHASLAPGYSNNGREDVDARLDVAYKNKYRFRAGYQLFNDVQTGVGVNYALDNLGSSQTSILTLDFAAKNNIAENIDLDSKLYFYSEYNDFNHYFLPPGSFNNLLPRGANNTNNGDIRTTGFLETLSYKGLKDHDLTLGAGLSYSWQYNNSNKYNFLITPTFIGQISPTELSSITFDPLKNVSDRINAYALFQDEWHFARDWHLTSGLRYDYYSDVSDGLSPKVSLIWNVDPFLTTK